ncbi:TPA: baseplate J/gp47 family protein [Vibrio cholerae]|uniref:baseplate assembly protein n=1 Tax=Vibrio cholerae TaxID=666 RepID=UPI002083F72F|nr:baseplate assembly protein [Vibrio cholerae]GHZ39091.1 Phage-related baseplate assembly protein [Vibrio cholerae]HDZ9268245.1 baseplate J/gp47 family protein [Vibrio cholerae]HDZ9497799.1 baseplate J/gp47 family protein [Vibrio cholerae]
MSQIEIYQLPPPEVVQQLDASFIRTRMLKRYAELSNTSVPKAGDPLYFAFSAMSEEVTRARQEFQDISLENMVAFSSGANLQHLGVARPVEKYPTETDEQYRRRIQMAPEGFSTAGPDGAYIFHALNAHEDVLDAYPLSPSEVTVNLYIVSRKNDGVATPELCDIVYKHVDAQSKRPLSDKLSVLPASINRYRIEVALHMPTGPGEQQTLKLAEQRLQKLANDTHRLGGEVSFSAIYAAAHVKRENADSVYQPVSKVELIEPLEEIICSKAQAPYCYEIVVKKAGA